MRKIRNNCNFLRVIPTPTNYSDIISDSLSGIYFDMFSGILSGIYSDILSNVYFHMFLAFFLTLSPGILSVQQSIWSS